MSDAEYAWFDYARAAEQTQAKSGECCHCFIDAAVLLLLSVQTWKLPQIGKADHLSSCADISADAPCVQVLNDCHSLAATAL